MSPIMLMPGACDGDRVCVAPSQCRRTYGLPDELRMNATDAAEPPASSACQPNRATA
jgi:hypothetical protein